MQRLAIALAVLSCVPVQAQQGVADLMKTPACLEARKTLDAALAAGGPRDKLAAARELAGLKCLGQKPPPLPEGRFLPPPEPLAPLRLRLAPLRLRPAPALAPPPPNAPTAAPPPPLAIPRPPVITHCDASGCWDNNGTRYNQQGPVLLGPRGVCTQQAGVLNCP